MYNNSSADGNWGQWSDWLPPSGPKNTIMRKRLCDSPPPSNDGQDCIGDDFEIYNETIGQRFDFLTDTNI